MLQHPIAAPLSEPAMYMFKKQIPSLELRPGASFQTFFMGDIHCHKERIYIPTTDIQTAWRV